MPRRARSREDSKPGARQGLDVNQVVAYNLRAARELRGLTQQALADLLGERSGKHITPAMVSALERAWDGERPREFDAHEIALFASVLDVPIVWFFLPPPDDYRPLKDLELRATDLYILLLGRHTQLEPLYDRLREVGIDDPTPYEEAVEKITGEPSVSRRWSYRHRRKELMLAFLDDHADDLDNAADKLGAFFDHLRQVGVRGFVAENTNDADFGTPAENRSSTPDDTEQPTHDPSHEPQDVLPGALGDAPDHLRQAGVWRFVAENTNDADFGTPAENRSSTPDDTEQPTDDPSHQRRADSTSSTGSPSRESASPTPRSR